MGKIKFMMKFKNLAAFICAMFISFFSFGQQDDTVYTKPLNDVLSNVAKKFNVKVEFDPKLVEGINVQYAQWRYTSDINSTLNNILLPVNLTYNQKDQNAYQIGPYEYYRRSEAEGRKHLEILLKAFPDSSSFNKRKTELRKCIADALGINLNAAKNSLNPIMRGKKMMSGYTVENVAFESFPGYFVTGTLYRPAKGKGPFPVVLNPHGHFYNEDDPTIAKDSGRYRSDMQMRCASLAKMGAIAFNYDMYSWGESVLFSGNPSFHHAAIAVALQTWNTIRSIDFLLTIPGADKKRIAITGASGGGTQTILAAALDGRITVSAPVVMVSSSFYGGCECESGLPIHQECSGYATNNAEIAAMFAPKPLFVVSDGSDWTKSVPGTDYPYLQKVYGFYNAQNNVGSIYLPNDKHDYGITKREPVYKFLAKKLGLNLQSISKNNHIEETGITIQTNDEMRVFREYPLPASALRSHDEIVKSFNEVHKSGNEQ
jgi:dienelactone hydrolase